jgi:hypothetical protein
MIGDLDWIYFVLFSDEDWMLTRISENVEKYLDELNNKYLLKSDCVVI